MRATTARKGAVVPESRAPLISTAIAEASRTIVEGFRGRTPGAWLSEEQKDAIVTLLAMCDGNTLQVQRLLDGAVSHTMIWNIRSEKEAALFERREAWKKTAAVASQRIFEKATAQVEDTIHTASSRDAAVVAGIFAEKSALFAGDAITVNHVHSLNPAQLQQLGEISSRLRQIRPAQPDVIEADFEVIE